MIIYRVTFGEGKNFEILSYHTTVREARKSMVEIAQEEKEFGMPWDHYTCYRIEKLDLSSGNATEDDWELMLYCEELTDLFPQPDSKDNE